MSTVILTSMFNGDFPVTFSERLSVLAQKRGRFAFVASDFQIHNKTDQYFRFFYSKFEKAGITFDENYVIDSRMTKEDAQKKLAQADVIWLSGGDTPVEMHYLREYGLVDILFQHSGVIIGMSAGALNLSKHTVCSKWLHEGVFNEYDGIGLVDFLAESHFNPQNFEDALKEIYELSSKYELYELCDESFIVFQNGKKEFYGEIYHVCEGKLQKVGNKQV